MTQETLMRFIRRIIDTSPDMHSARLALCQLKEILADDLGKSDLELLDLAASAVCDKFDVMKSPDAALTPDALRISAARAREIRIRTEMAERQGRC